MSIPFGKYKNKSIEWIYKNDKDYFKWLESIPLKEPFASEFAQFHLDLVIEIENMENAHVNKVLFKIDEYIKNKEPIYYVNVHSVGIEFRFKDISLEDILGKTFTLWYSDKGKHISVNLTKENYNILYNILNNYWQRTGKQTQDRGLY